KEGRDLGEYPPQLRFYPTMNEAIGRPAVRTGPLSDAYLTVASADPEATTAHVRLTATPMVLWLWVSGGVIAAGVLVGAWPTRAQRRSSRRRNDEQVPVGQEVSGG